MKTYFGTEKSSQRILVLLFKILSARLVFRFFSSCKFLGISSAFLFIPGTCLAIPFASFSFGNLISYIKYM